MFKHLNPFRIIIATLILFIPLYPKFPLASVNGTYVAIRLDDIVIALTVLFWFIYQLKHRFPVFKSKITLLFIAYFIAIFISTLNAILVFQTTSTSILLLNAFRRFEYISLFFVALGAVKTRRDFLYPYIFLLVAMLGIAIYGYGQKYLQFPVISTMNEEFSKGQLLQMNVWTRISSTFAGHYDLAAYLSLVLVIIAAVAAYSKKASLKYPSLLAFLVGFHLLTLTASRVSIFALWGSLILMFFFLRKYIWIVPVSILVVFSMINSKDLNQRLLATIPSLKMQLNRENANLVPTLTPTPIPTSTLAKPSGVIAIVSTHPTTPTPTVFRHPATEIYTPVDTDVGVARSGEIRFNVEWPRAITAFRKNVISGTGLGSITLATDNDYLRTLGESGIVGFVTFTIIFLYFFIATLPYLRHPTNTLVGNLPIVFLAVVVSLWANAIFIDIFEASKVAYTTWIIMAFYYQSLHLKK